MAGTRKLAAILVADIVGYSKLAGAEAVPEDTTAQIRFQAAGFPRRRVTATLVFEGAEGTHEGVLPESYLGFMNCADKTSLPLRLWTAAPLALGSAPRR